MKVRDGPDGGGNDGTGGVGGGGAGAEGAGGRRVLVGEVGPESSHAADKTRSTATAEQRITRFMFWPPL